LRRFLRAKLLWALSRSAALLPLRMAQRLGAALGRAAFALAPRQRRLALAHLAVAFPDLSEGDRRSIARASFANLGRMAFELSQARKIDRCIHDFVRWDETDIAALRGVVQPGRGALFITGHIGNWELLARRIVAEGVDHLVVGRTPGDPGLAALLADMRREGGIRVVDRSALSARREILSGLRRGALVGILIDQDTRVQGMFVPFFGRLAHTPRIAEDLARRFGTPVLVGFAHHRPDGGYLLRTEVFGTGGPEASGLTQQLTARIEAEIRAHPDEWVWMHERWRRQPGDELNTQSYY
jgi:KDO2-lipid IV(A) lauroyltransferase